MNDIFGVLKRTSTQKEIDSLHNAYLKIIFKRLAEQAHANDHSTGMVVFNTPAYKSYKSTTGTVTTKRPGNIHIFKDAVPPSKFFRSNKFNHIEEKIKENTFAILGSTSFCSSRQMRLNANNSPFVCGDIVGVCRGTITNTKELLTHYNLKLKGTCSEEIIFLLINTLVNTYNLTIKAAIQRAFYVLKGEYVCVLVYTKNPNQVFMFRKGVKLEVKHCKTAVIFTHQDGIDDLDLQIIEPQTNIPFKDRSCIVLNNSFGSEWVNKIDKFEL